MKAEIVDVEKFARDLCALCGLDSRRVKTLEIILDRGEARVTATMCPPFEDKPTPMPEGKK